MSLAASARPASATPGSTSTSSRSRAGGAPGAGACLKPRYRPVWAPPRERAELDYRAAAITAIIWCTGFRTDYGWIDLPVFNGRGQPAHVRGVTPVPGVYFLGLPWLYT
jgi:putative flavoprotein involved in K+ transport